MADISTVSSISCGLEKTTTEVFQPLGERQAALKNRINFMVVDYVGLKDVVADDNIDELELTDKHESYMNLRHELFDDFRVFYEDAGTMIKENLDHNSATRIKRIHKFLKDA